MLTASILKLFYWPGSRYDPALLIQACIMIAVQVILLKVALDNRGAGLPSHHYKGRHEQEKGEGLGKGGGGRGNGRRPWNFWRWGGERPYWEFLGGLTLVLLCCQTYFKPSPSPSSPNSNPTPDPSWADIYTLTIGYLGLAIEAILPIPQLLDNQRARSCKGFRVSVLANWLVGDALKMGFFFAAGGGRVPWAFKGCAVVQAGCDVGLGVQWWCFGDGEGGGGKEVGYGNGKVG